MNKYPPLPAHERIRVPKKQPSWWIEFESEVIYKTNLNEEPFHNKKSRYEWKPGPIQEMIMNYFIKNKQRWLTAEELAKRLSEEIGFMSNFKKSLRMLQERNVLQRRRREGNRRGQHPFEYCLNNECLINFYRYFS